MDRGPSAPPSFRAEIYYLVAKFLEDGPCQDAANALRRDLETHELVPPRYDWTGNRHQKTFRDMEDEFGKVNNEFLLRKCFELCDRLNPGQSSVRSMLQKERRLSAPMWRSNLHRLSLHQIGISDNCYKTQWYSQLAKSLKLLRRTFGHLSSVYCLIFDQTGRLVITGADDMLVKVWSFIDARLIHTFRGASAEISDLAVSPDNRLVAAGSCDKVIRVWELHSGCPVAVLTKHTGTITAINFCPYLLNDDGGRYLASTSGDGTVSFWRYKYDEYGHTDFEAQPTRYHEKIRPGNTQMICAAFSPGGIFFVVGSADQNVRVYKMNGPDGPIRILEEELHEDRVESIQWCNTPNELRFISGSRDGTARIWSYSHQRWKTLVLNMKTGDNQEPSKKRDLMNQQPKPSTSVTTTSTSRSGRTTTSTMQLNPEDQESRNANNENEKKIKGVTMVAWSLDDALAITAVSDWTLKIWDSHKGKLMYNLLGHENDIFVLEPHPFALNLLLTAAHDGHMIVWDLDTQSILFKHRNMIEEQGNTQGHGPVFDAKWSKDGATICASDSHGHVMFIGHGSAERYNKCPTELFFHTDYRPLLRDSFHNVVDEQTQLPPHLLPPPFLVDSEGDPYPAYVQRLVRGRENMNERDALVPIGPEPSFQAPHQHQAPEEEPEQPQQDEQQPENENPEERLNRFRNEMIRNLPSNQGGNQAAPEADENGEASQADEDNAGENVAHDDRTTKLVILRDNVNAREITENVEKTKAFSLLESALFISESNRDAHDHDYYARPINKDKSKQKAKKDARANQRQRQRQQEDDEEEEEEDEENRNQNDENNGDQETSDCSLDESDFSSAESTTEVSSEHSDWGSDHEPAKEQVPTKKKSSPKNKKKRHAAQKCREKMLLPGGDIGEEFIPSPWLSATIPRKTPYFPQIGDVLMYFKSGHARYIDLVEIRKAYKLNMREQQWMRKKNLEESTMVKVVDIKFEIRPPRLCVLKLAILNERSGKSTGESFTIKYHDMNDVVDFLVLHQAFNSHKGKHWKKGDRIRCQIDDKWWKGTVNKVENKESPFLSIWVHWDNGDKEFLSPWDLEFLDNDSMEIEDGEDIPPDQLTKSLYIPTSEEWNNIGRESESMRISEAMKSIMELAIAEPFNYPVDLTSYPEYMVDVEYPMDLTCIKSRVDSHFYRRVDAIKHDIKYIYTNAASFNRPKSDIVRNAKVISKLAIEIVGDTSKTKDDVSSIYHRLVESFQWSSSDSSEDDDDDDDDEEDDEDNDDETSKSRTRRSKKKQPPNLNPKKWKNDCDRLLNEAMTLPFSKPFREPVSDIQFPDYHRYVATPMDLSTVRESLHIGDYSNPFEFQKDVQLIFKNSKEYNTNPNTPVLKMTHRFEEWFEQKIRGLIQDWRNTNRRLTIAKRKHKAKKADQSPDYKGKGKGKGKGQSNKIKRKRNDSSGEEQDDDTDDEDYENPKPGPSRASPKKKPPVPSTAAPPLRNAITEANAGRRTSSRQSRPPLRFQDESEPEENEESAAPKRASRPREPSTSSTRCAAIKKQEDEDDDEEVPLAKKTSVKRVVAKVKEEDEEEEPLVKRSSRKVSAPPASSDSEEDIPLAARRKVTESPVKSDRHNRPAARSNRRHEESESEDDRPLRRSNKRPRRQSSSSTPRKNSRRRQSKKSKNASRSNRRRMAKRQRRDESSESQEESDESESEEQTSESSEQSEQEEAPLPARRATRKVVVHEEESEEEIIPQRKRRQADERSRNGRFNPNNPGPSSGSSRRRNVKRPVYFEDEDEEEPPVPVKRKTADSRRPSRRFDEYEEEESESEEASSANDDEEESDEESSSREKAYLSKKQKKTTVTSRGRVSKPNPRII